MSDLDKILDRIQKLFALGASPNEHEARLATEKANELLVKYNLSLQDVGKHGAKEFADHEFIRKSRVQADERLLLNTISKHFFVRIILRRVGATFNPLTVKWEGEPHYRILFIGEKSNVQIAAYVHGFLLHTVRRLWKEEKLARGLSEKFRPTFIVGFAEGLDAQLTKARARAEASMSLVIVPDRDLERHVSDRFPRLGNAGRVTVREDAATRAAGFQQGQSVRIHKGVGGGATNNGLALGKGKS